MTDKTTRRGLGDDPPLTRDDLKSILTPSPFDMLEAAIEAYDDTRENGRARPQSIDILRTHLRRAYRLGAAEALAELVKRGRIEIEPYDFELTKEIIRNRGTTAEAKKRG